MFSGMSDVPTHPVQGHPSLSSASLQTFGVFPTCVLGGLMGDHFGRKMSLMLIAPLFCGGFVLQMAARDVALLLFGRLVTGAAAGLACGPTAARDSLNCR